MTKINLMPKKSWKTKAFKGLSIVAQVTLIFQMSSLGVFLVPQSHAAQACTWITPACSTDPINDENPAAIDLFGTASEPAAQYAWDGSWVKFRERVDNDPSGPGKFAQYSWTVLFQLGNVNDYYDYLVSLNGLDEKVQLWQNTADKNPLTWAPIVNDPAETLLWQADTTDTYAKIYKPHPSSTDYWVEWSIPTAQLTALGININTKIYFATATDANNFNKDHLDCYEPVSFCGDGVIQTPNDDGINELCDDGNKLDGDGCSAVCTIEPFCGDGNIDPGEECGEPGLVTPEHYTCNQCKLTYIPYCGDGNVDSGEVCDDGGQNGQVCTPAYNSSCSYCSDICQPVEIPGPFCGDKIVQDQYEECDGSAPANYTCTQECKLEYVPYCGDGNLDAGEECDDANNVNGDGCSATCEKEPGKIYGYKFNDLNENGIWDSGEPALGGVTVNLTGDASGSDVTDAGSGWYAFYNLNAGSYTVTEVVPAGWHATTTISVPVSLSQGEYKKVNFGNHRDNGNLIVKKNVDTDGDGDIDEFNVSSWTWDILNGEQNIATGSTRNLETGLYTISEDQKENFHVTNLTCGDVNYGAVESAQVDLSVNGLVCTFTNTRDTGLIKVNKKVDADGNGSFEGGNTEANALGFFWGIDSETPARTMGSEQSVVTGNYNITENDINNYHFVGWYANIPGANFSCENPEGTSLPINLNVLKDNTAEITLCNAHDGGDLRIRKALDTNGDGQVDVWDPQGWTYDIDAGNQNYAMGSTQNVLTGNHIVSEDQQSGFSSLGWSCTDGTWGYGEMLNVDVTVNGVTCVFTNVRDTGTIIVHKNVLDPDEEEVSDNHQFTVKKDGAESQIIAEGTDAAYLLVPTGEYTMTEDTDNNYEFVSFSLDNDLGTEGAQITVSKNEVTELTVTNKQKKTTIYVYKDVRDWQGNDVSDNTTFDFNYDNGSGSVSEQGATWVEVNPGSYEFNEVANPDYDVKAGYFEVTIGSNEIARITFINWQKPSQITGYKFEDLNGNGSWDAGEPALEGWEICLLQAIGPVALTTEQPENGCLATEITDENGYYEFNGLKPGLYGLQETLQDGWIQTAQPSAIELGLNQTSENNNFGNLRLGKISGYKYDDLGNKLNDWKICLISGGYTDNVSDVNFGVTVIQRENCQYTGAGEWADGYYEFTNIYPGTYNLAETIEDGWRAINPADGQYSGLILTSGATLAKDFVNQQKTYQINLTKSDSPDPVSPGGFINYTLTWSVAGNTKVTNLVLTDPLPANAIFSSVANGGVYDDTAKTVTWNLGEKNPGDSGTVTFVVKALANLHNGTIITNTATLDSSETEPVSASANTTITSAPILNIEKTVDLAFANPGNVVTYTVVVSNTGNETAYEVVLTDTLPTGFTFNPEGTATKSWALGDLLPGGSKTVNYEVNVGKSVTAGFYDNLAEAVAKNHGKVTDKATVEVRVPSILSEEAYPQLTISKIVDKSSVNPNSLVNYSVTISNKGEATAYNVILTDKLPAGFTFTDTGLGEKTWKLGDMTPGNSITMNYEVLVGKDVKAGDYLNLATVKADNHDPLTASVNVNVKQGVVLGITGPKWYEIFYYLLGLLFVFGGIKSYQMIKRQEILIK